MRGGNVIPARGYSGILQPQELADSVLTTLNGGAIEKQPDGSPRFTGAATNTDTAGGATITRLMIDTEFRATNTLSHISAQGLAADDGVAVGTVAGRFPARVMAGALHLLLGALRLATTAGPFDIDVRALATPALMAGESWCTSPAPSRPAPRTPRRPPPGSRAPASRAG